MTYTNPDGFQTSFTYDPATSAVTGATEDTSGLHLVTQDVVDALGRAVQVTDPNGNVSYAVFDDPTTASASTPAGRRRPIRPPARRASSARTAPPAPATPRS